MGVSGGRGARRIVATELRDYIVIPADGPHLELWKQTDELTERRARKRAGVGPDEPFEGRIHNEPVHPLDMLR